MGEEDPRRRHVSAILGGLSRPSQGGRFSNIIEISSCFSQSSRWSRVGGARARVRKRGEYSPCTVRFDAKRSSVQDEANSLVSPVREISA